MDSIPTTIYIGSDSNKIAAVREWISVEDELPSEPDEYLVYLIDPRQEHDGWIELTDFDGLDFLEGFMEVGYWMPLPDPPKHTTGGGDE